MRLVRGVAIALLVVALQQLACGGEVVAPSFDDAMMRLSVSQCARHERCWPDTFSTTWQSLDECASSRARRARMRLGSPYVRDAVGFAERCAAALDADGCTYGEPAACRPDTGTQPLGGFCLSGFDCAGGTCAILVSTAVTETPFCGRCSVAGPPRTAGCRDCRVGDTCIDDACRPPGKLGESCGLVGCQTDLRCVGGVCESALARGDACDPARSSCVTSDTCDPVTRTCVPRRRAALGEPCGYLGDRFVECERASVCSNDAAGTCVPRVADGQPCNLEVGPGCNDGSTCFAGVCRPISVAMCTGDS
ncbi:MAG: hypothetical protein HYV09_23550 [Deltaproteobacteria bacterium]|nr:hypothetical protein [Deltaproteobacteria bacterium]